LEVWFVQADRQIITIDIVGLVGSAASDVSELGRQHGTLASVVNHSIVTDPTIQQPGFDLQRHTWSLMNRFRTGQGPCRASLQKWGLAQSPSCDCGQRQTMNHAHC